MLKKYSNIGQKLPIYTFDNLFLHERGHHSDDQYYALKCGCVDDEIHKLHLNYMYMKAYNR